MSINLSITTVSYIIPHRLEKVQKLLTLNMWYLRTYHSAFKGLKSSHLEDDSEP
jgi:hypothetical protein